MLILAGACTASGAGTDGSAGSGPAMDGAPTIGTLPEAAPADPAGVRFDAAFARARIPAKGTLSLVNTSGARLAFTVTIAVPVGDEDILERPREEPVVVQTWTEGLLADMSCSDLDLHNLGAAEHELALMIEDDYFARNEPRGVRPARGALVQTFIGVETCN